LSSRSDHYTSDNELKVATGIKLYGFTRDTGMNLVVMIVILWIQSRRVNLACPKKGAD